MKQATLVIFLVQAVLRTIGLETNITFQTCCDMGLKSALEYNSCLTTEPAPGIQPEEQSLCLSIIELCCARKIREMDCEDGKDAAKTGGSCPEQKNKDEQHCCESCKLGLVTGSMGANCQLGEVSFGRLWDSAFYSCCTQSNEREAEGNQQEQNVCEILQGELCAHICTPSEGSYVCECQPGYKLMADKKGCEYITRCSKASCSQLCEEESEGIRCSCYEGYQLENDNFTCSRIKPIDSTCMPGFRLHPAAKVCLDIDECVEDSPCDSNQQCLNSPGGYDCVCKPGLAMDRITLACKDVDECAHNPCDQADRCVNTFGSYICESTPPVKSTTPPLTASELNSSQKSCPFGFENNGGSGDCVDVDECIEQPCDSTQNCVNTVGSYNCECKPGFQRDNFTEGCVDINECQINQSACLEGERCDNAPGSYGCVRLTSCGTGYTFNQAANKCEDDDECKLGTDTCRFIGPEWGCKNVQGSFRCIRNRTRITKVLLCPAGYTLDDSKTKCLDINECLTGQHNCKSNEICANTDGHFTCRQALECKPGLRLREDGRRCNDINECAENPGICSQRCINTWGSFMCGCDPGYKLQADKRTCVDDNECSYETKHRRVCMGICVNKPGSYHCECPEGYRLGSDRFSCIDIDECANYPCSENEVCTNIQGSYRCSDTTCQPGFVKDRYKSTKCVSECYANNGDCRDKLFSYTMHFIDLVANASLPPNGLKFFTMGSSGRNSRADFDILPPESDAPPSTEKASEENFRLDMIGTNSAALYLQKPLQGPQDVHLVIKMSYFDDDIYLGYTLIKIDLLVSQFTY